MSLLLRSFSRRPLARALALTMAFAMVLAGCSVGSGGSKSDSTSSTPHRGGTLTVGARAEPDTLNPYNYGSGDVRNILVLLYDTLVEYDLKSGELVPGLAESWEGSENGETWTLRLRSGVKWHDGKEFTSADAKWSIEQAKKPAAGRTTSELTSIDSLGTPDDSTLVIRLKTPDRELLATLLDVYMTPMGHEDYEENPIGTGPFKFDDWVHNQQVVVTRNDDYWKEGRPYLDKVVVKTVSDSTIRAQQLVSGQLDMVTIVPFNEIDNVEQAGMVITKMSGGSDIPQGIYDLRINTREGPLADARVRQAMSYAVDRKAISEALLGKMPIFSNPVPRSDPLFNQEAPNYDERDVDKAKQLLEEAGYPDGVDIGVLLAHVDAGFEYEIISQLVQAELAEAGITVEVRNTDIATWVDLVLTQHQFDVGLSRNLPRPTAYDYIAQSWSKTIGEAMGWDEASPEFASLLNMTRATTDDDEYAADIKKLQTLGMEGQPSVILGGAVNPAGYPEYVRGFIPHPQTVIFLTDVWLDK